MTKKENYENLMNLVNNSTVENKSELTAFIEHEIELLNRKASSSSAANEKKKSENASLKAQIAEVLASINKPVTVTEMMTDGSLTGYTNAKITAMLTQMLGEPEQYHVMRTTEKKRAYYSIG